MKSNYDFSKGIKNPYVDKLKNGYAVTIRYNGPKDKDNIGKDASKPDKTIAFKKNEVHPRS